MQIICVAIRKEVMLNRLEDVLALNIYVWGYTIVEGFKTEQS